MKSIKALLIILIQITGFIAIAVLDWKNLPLSLIIFNVAYLLYAQVSFSMGWHRYFSHKAFETSKYLEWIFYIGGSSMFIGSMFEWLAEHKHHHAYLNTTEDPTNRTRGWLYSHLGWIVLFTIGSDKINKIIKKNKRYEVMYKLHYPFYFFFSIVVPWAVSYGLYPDAVQSFLISVALRLMLLHHTLGLLNSYCHNEDPSRHTINSIVASVLCMGEGYQLNHHLSPNDYRFGKEKFDWDPTKWLIYLCYKLKIVNNLKTNIKETEKC